MSLAQYEQRRRPADGSPPSFRRLLDALVGPGTGSGRRRGALALPPPPPPPPPSLLAATGRGSIEVAADAVPSVAGSPLSLCRSIFWLSSRGGGSALAAKPSCTAALAAGWTSPLVTIDGCVFAATLPSAPAAPVADFAAVPSAGWAELPSLSPSQFGPASIAAPPPERAGGAGASICGNPCVCHPWPRRQRHSRE